MTPARLELLAALPLVLAVAAGCGDKSGDSGPGTGAGTGSDDGDGTGGGTGDAGDAGGGAGDGGEGTGGDGGVDLPLDGLGTLSGDCDVIDTELTDPSPSLFVNTLDFGTTAFDRALLSEGGQAIHDAGNLGGSSLYSEIFAYEVLYRCELAALLETEADIVYTDPNGKKTDFLVELDGETIGVSVTRAFAWPPEDPYTVEQATELLTDKLGDVQLSSANVGAEHAWRKQVLSVIAYTPDHATSIVGAWDALDPAVRGDTIVLVTVTEGDDEALY